MTLTKDSLEWAIESVWKHSDSDLFPRVEELNAIRSNKDYFIDLLEGKPIGDFRPGPHRRFLIPKDDLSYRPATQLDPQDSIILSAIIHQFGSLIESRRLSSDRVFSYRFSPSTDYGLYNNQGAWDKFWREAGNRASSANSVLYCDISDFYNQVYHHEVENQLIESGLPNQSVKWIIQLIEETTAGVSRGVPIGPHGSHLLAESTLIPIDSSLQDSGLNFIRYADDYIFFTDSDNSSRAALAIMARVLDEPQRLQIQRHKTKICSTSEFDSLCTQMLNDCVIDSNEQSLLDLIKKYSGGDPYITILASNIDAADWATVSASGLRNVIENYLKKPNVDYVRLRWLYRRLAQIGHPGAIEATFDNIDKLTPCLSSICFYIGAIQTIDSSDWVSVGSRLLQLIDNEQVSGIEYFGILLMSLFGRNKGLNHFQTLSQRFQSSSSEIRREILLAAKTNLADGWIRQFKQSFPAMDHWQKQAFIYCCSMLPEDERKYFINRQAFYRPFDKTLAKWCKDV